MVQILSAQLDLMAIPKLNQGACWANREPEE
jgi:hypothetical protein